MSGDGDQALWRAAFKGDNIKNGYIINQNIPNRKQRRFLKAHCQKKII